MRISLAAALVPSAALWIAVNLEPSINVPNWLDPDGWYFNPFAWQFLFALGAAGATVTARAGGSLPRRVWLVLAAWIYLGLSALEAFPYGQYGLPNLAPLALQASGKDLAGAAATARRAVHLLPGDVERGRAAGGGEPGRARLRVAGKSTRWRCSRRGRSSTCWASSRSIGWARGSRCRWRSTGSGSRCCLRSPRCLTGASRRRSGPRRWRLECAAGANGGGGVRRAARLR